MYALLNSSFTTLRIFTTVGTLEFVQGSTPKGNMKCFRQGLLSNDEMRCCQQGIAEEQTKFKKNETSTKSIRIYNEYASQMADTLNNAWWVFDHFEKIQGNLCPCPGIDIRRLSLQQLYLYIYIIKEEQV